MHTKGIIPLSVTSTELYDIICNTQTNKIELTLENGTVYKFRRANNTMYFSSVINMMQGQEWVFSYSLAKNAQIEIDNKYYAVKRT